jgi:hypothetical protein
MGCEEVLLLDEALDDIVGGHEKIELVGLVLEDLFQLGVVLEVGDFDLGAVAFLERRKDAGIEIVAPNEDLEGGRERVFRHRRFGDMLPVIEGRTRTGAFLVTAGGQEEKPEHAEAGGGPTPPKSGAA